MLNSGNSLSSYTMRDEENVCQKSPRGTPLKGKPYMSIGEYVDQPVNGIDGETHAEKFFRTEASKDRYKRGYVRRLREMKWFYTPSDVKDQSIVMIFNKERFNAASRFFDYIERNLLDDDNRMFNGYDLNTFKSTIKSANKEYEKNYKEDVGNITYNPTPDEIRNVMKYVGEIVSDKSVAGRVQILMYMAAYCGARLEQLCRYLTRHPPNERHYEFFPKNTKKKEFFRIDVSDIGEGEKNTMFYYFPYELITAMRTMTLKTRYDTVGGYVANAGRNNVMSIPELDEYDNPTGKETIEKRPITFKTLRKYNMLKLVLSGVDSQVANAIQGRKALGVDAEHYIKYGNETAIQQYPLFLAVLRNELPIPVWIQKYQDGMEIPGCDIDRI